MTFMMMKIIRMSIGDDIDNNGDDDCDYFDQNYEEDNLGNCGDDDTDDVDNNDDDVDQKQCL
jgi:hypothetical protein